MSEKHPQTSDRLVTTIRLSGAIAVYHYEGFTTPNITRVTLNRSHPLPALAGSIPSQGWHQDIPVQ